MASYLVVSAVQPTFELVVRTAAEPLDLCFTSPSPTARATAATASASMSTGPVWKGIVAVADDLDTSVVVVGSRGLSGAREVLERRLSHDLARRAGQRPIVPPAARCG